MYNATYLLPTGEWQKIATFESREDAFRTISSQSQFKPLVWPINAETNAIAPYVLGIVQQLAAKITELSVIPQTDYTKDLIGEIYNAISNISDSLCFEVDF